MKLEELLKTDYKIGMGSIIKIDHESFILSQTAKNNFQFISLEDGNRWSDNLTPLSNFHLENEEQLLSLLGNFWDDDYEIEIFLRKQRNENI